LGNWLAVVGFASMAYDTRSALDSKRFSTPGQGARRSIADRRGDLYKDKRRNL